MREFERKIVAYFFSMYAGWDYLLGISPFRQVKLYLLLELYECSLSSMKSTSALNFKSFQDNMHCLENIPYDTVYRHCSTVYPYSENLQYFVMEKYVTLI